MDMHKTLSFLPLLTLLGVTASPASALAQARRMTLAQAIESSVERDLEVASTAKGVTAAELKTSGTGAQRFPKLRAEANILRWDTPLLINFGPMAMAGAGMPPPSSSKLVARDRYTSSAVISLAQPLSGLFVLGHLVAIDRSAVQGARAEVARARLDAAQRTAEAYLRVLQTRAIADVAEKGLAQIAAQLARSETLEKAGVASRVDVLRLASARDAARQTLVRAQTNVEIAQGQLALALDLPPDTTIEVADDFPNPPSPPTLTEADVAATAGADRPELSSAAARTQQAEGARIVALAQWLPNVMAVGNYQHIEGQGPFQPRNAWYIGATLTWDVWDWGKTQDAVKEAAARAGQSHLAERALRNQILSDARRRLLETKAAFASLEPARTSLVAAEEAHRIQTVRYEKGVASTTDIIDAETDVTRARSAYAQARYDYYLAQANLARAAGALPLVAAKK